jgi:hypothetical protein
MPGDSALNRFAPTILKTYRRDKEAFWSAVMAPFLLTSVSLGDMLHNLRVDAGLLSAFRGMDSDAHQTLAVFSAPLGFDLTGWKSNRPQYFKDAYPVFAFLAVWMDEHGLDDLIAAFGDILRAGVFAVAGYGILDENVDSDQPSPVEILTAQALIAEYEQQALHIFGVTPVNLEIMHRMRSLFLEAEIREKYMRGKASPYSLDHPEGLGGKGANSVAPFMLSLEQLGKAALIEEYWEVFLKFGAAIQMIDDWEDLEKDLAIGHFSYITLGCERMIDPKDAAGSARRIRSQTDQVHATYDRSKEMIAESRAILDRLVDPYLLRLVDVTDLRVDQFFRKTFKVF